MCVLAVGCGALSLDDPVGDATLGDLGMSVGVVVGRLVEVLLALSSLPALKSGETGELAMEGATEVAMEASRGTVG